MSVDETTRERIKKAISESTGCALEELVLEADLYDDLGWDSLDLVQLAIDLEDTFGLASLPDDELHDINTVGELVVFLAPYVERKVA